tara:strand:+ start:888 stop:1706 length:819 start_codon:yes stop_codon:yes gene_type:complete
MIFLKRQFATIVLIFMGFLALSGNFINNKALNDFIDKDATQWYEIIAGFAAFLGVLNLIKLHFGKISYKKKNWEYSVLTLISFFIMIFFGFFYNDSQVPFGSHLKDESSTFYWIFNFIYLPLASTMFALLAFFVASASYRAFRIRNFEASLLLVSGVLLMIGRVPIGSIIPWYIVTFLYVVLFFILFGHYFKDRRKYFISFLIINALLFFIGFSLNWHSNTPPFLSIPLIQEWIFAVPATAGARAIMIGIALGTVAQSFRIITGREKTILGD